MSKDEEQVVFGYASSKNVTFRGKVDSGYTWAEWNDLDDRAKSEAMSDAANELVELWVEGE